MRMRLPLRVLHQTGIGLRHDCRVSDLWLTRICRLATLVCLMTCASAAAPATAQSASGMRGGGGSGTDRPLSPAVLASWMWHHNYANDSKTSLLVLWRGSPGWMLKPGPNGGGGGSSSSGGGSVGFQSFRAGGLSFSMEYDYDRVVVKLLNQELSLREVNVILVDGVDTAAPSIVRTLWVEPPAANPSPSDNPIGAIISRQPDLFEYLRCDLKLSDTPPDPSMDPRILQAMDAMMTIVCNQMRPQ